MTNCNCNKSNKVNGESDNDELRKMSNKEFRNLTRFQKSYSYYLGKTHTLDIYDYIASLTNVAVRSSYVYIYGLKLKSKNVQGNYDIKPILFITNAEIPAFKNSLLSHSKCTPHGFMLITHKMLQHLDATFSSEFVVEALKIPRKPKNFSHILIIYKGD